MKAVLVVATPYDPAQGARVTVRFCNWNDPSVTLVSGGPGEFLPLLTGGPVISRSLFNGDFTGAGTANDSNMTIRIDEAGLDGWMNYVWDSSDCTIYVGDQGAAFASYVQVWKGRTGGILREKGSRVTATIPLMPIANLDRPLLYLAFAGTDVGTSGDTGEGRTELQGVLKPWLSGNAKLLQPVLLDSARQIYCYHAYGPTGGATAAYEGGVSKGAPTYTWASYAAMRDAVLASNEWGHCPSLGMIRLGGAPSFPVTIDAGGDAPSGTVLTKVGDIAKRILEGPGGMTAPAIPASTITNLNAIRPQAVDIYATSQLSVAQLLTDLMLSANGYWVENESGQIILGLLTRELQGYTDGFPAAESSNLLSSTEQDLTTWGSANGATQAKSRSFVRFTDASATAQGAYTLTKAVTAGAPVTFVARVEKDKAAPTPNRFAAVNVVDGGNGYTAYINPLTGAAQTANSLSAANLSVRDAGDCWLVAINLTPSSASLSLQLYPAAGTTFPTSAVAATGTCGFKLPQLISGTVTPIADRTIDLDGKASPAVKSASEQPTGVPAYRVRVGGNRTWFVHQPSDVPASIAAAQSTADAATYTYPASATAPTSGPVPSEGDLWPDNSTGIVVTRRYTSGSWVAVTEIGANVRLVAIGSMAATDVAGNSFKRTAAGFDYNYAVYSSQVLANSAFVRCGAPASGVMSIALDDDNSTTALASQKWLLEVSVTTGNWILYKDGTNVQSGSVGALALDTNLELRYIGNKVQGWIGGTKVAEQTESGFLTFYAKWWARQSGTVRQCASGYSASGVDPYADVTAFNTALGDGNRVRFSRVEGGTRGYQFTNPNSLAGLNWRQDSFAGKNYVRLSGSWTAASQSVSIFTDNASAFRSTVTGGERLYISTGLQIVSLPAGSTWGLYIAYFDSSGAQLSQPLLASGSGATGYNVRYGGFDTAPANAVFASVVLGLFSNGGTSGAWDFLMLEPMICSAGANQTTPPNFTPGPSSEYAADVTANVVGPASSNVLYDNAGTTFQSADDLVYLVQTATGTVTSGVTMTYKVLSGTFNGFNSTSAAQTITMSGGVGTISPTALTTDTAQLQINATLNGRALPAFTTMVNKQRAAATPTGTGGGGGGATDVPSQSSGFTSINTTTFTTITSSLTFTLPAGKTTLRCVVDLECVYPRTSNQGGPWDVEFKVVRGGVDQGAVQHSNPDPYLDSGGDFTTVNPGVMQYTLDMTGLTAGTQYTVTVQARVATGTLPTSGATMRFTGSVGLSAP